MSHSGDRVGDCMSCVDNRSSVMGRGVDRGGVGDDVRVSCLAIIGHLGHVATNGIRVVVNMLGAAIR